jgi:D-arabinose 1-dehydrogenase-like Zn-dependent alcohol dehydrogenase
VVIDRISDDSWPAGSHLPSEDSLSRNTRSAESEQITVCGSIMGTLQDMKDMMNFIVTSSITPEIGRVLSMEQAEQGIRAMWEGRTSGKTVFMR